MAMRIMGKGSAHWRKSGPGGGPGFAVRDIGPILDPRPAICRLSVFVGAPNGTRTRVFAVKETLVGSLAFVSASRLS